MALRYIQSYATPAFPALSGDFLYTITGTMPYTTAIGLSTGPLASPTPLAAQDNVISGGSAANNYVIITLSTAGVPTTVHAYAGFDINILPPTGSQINNNA